MYLAVTRSIRFEPSRWIVFDEEIEVGSEIGRVTGRRAEEIQRRRAQGFETSLERFQLLDGFNAPHDVDLTSLRALSNAELCSERTDRASRMSGSRLHASPHKREMFKMAVTIDTPITWRTVVRVGLVWAAEYAMLALIEDAPTFMKVATVLCSLSILFVLESQSLFTALPARAYKNAILTSLLLYTACVVYAIHIVERKEFIKDELAKLYTEGMNIGGTR